MDNNIIPEGLKQYTTYIPAELPSVYTIYNNKTIKKFNYNYINNVDNNSIFNYPYLLVSTYHGISNSKWKDELKFTQHPIIYGDSGGFQNMSMKAILNPIKVLRWQEKNCDVAFTFDLPIWFKEDNKTKLFKQEQTVKNSYIALDKKENKEMKLYASFQGHTVEEQNRILQMFKESGDINKFDGFAIGGLVPLSGNINELLKICLTFIDLVKEYKKPIHFFGISSDKVMIMLGYIAKKFDLRITFDSSSFSSGQQYRMFKNNNVTYKITDEFLKDNLIPCNCLICNITNNNIKQINNNTNMGRLITLHTLYHMIKTNVEINILLQNNQFKETFEKKHDKMLKLIDYVYDNGINDSIGFNVSNNSKQLSLFKKYEK